jgi:hypothetical protein
MSPLPARVYTVDEAAQLLGVTTRRVRLLLLDKTLTSGVDANGRHGITQRSLHRELDYRNNPTPGRRLARLLRHLWVYLPW